MARSGYAQLCSVSIAGSLLEPRWTMLILCELWSGSARFAEIQRGVPGIGPSLLTRRLREMEANGLVRRAVDPAGRTVGYTTTPMADELEPIVFALGAWAHRHVDLEPGLRRLDARVLLCSIRRKLDGGVLPRRRAVIEFVLREDAKEDFPAWLLLRPGRETDLCLVEPKAEVDLWIIADLRALTAAWMGHSTFAAEIAARRIELIGDAPAAALLSRWLIRSGFVTPERPGDAAGPAVSASA